MSSSTSGQENERHSPGYEKFELLEQRGVRHAFSVVPENMSFGAEQDMAGREALSRRLNEFLIQLGIPTKRQVTMTANLNKPAGNLVRIGAGGILLEELPLLRDIYHDPARPLVPEYPRFVDSSFEADGLFTTERGLTIEIVSRDCMTAVISGGSGDSPLTALLHGGRRQIEGGLADRALEKCSELGFRPGDLAVALGPRIGKCHYSFSRRALAEDEAGTRINETRWGTFLKETSSDVFTLDIGGLFVEDLVKRGVPRNQIAVSDVCTYEAQQSGISNASLRYQREHNLPAGRMISVACA